MNRNDLFYCNDVNIARELIKSLTTLVGNGADVNHMDDDRRTPLFFVMMLMLPGN